MIIRMSDLETPLTTLAALARRCETTDFDSTEGWHHLMSAIMYLKKQDVQPDPLKFTNKKVQPYFVRDIA